MQGREASRETAPVHLKQLKSNIRESIMTRQRSVPRHFAVAVLLIAGFATLGGRRLQAQEATASAAAPQAEVGTVPVAGTEVAPSPAASADAGPRVVPPLARYQATLPQPDRSSNAASMDGGGNHTIVISTLVLVLVVVIVVLLAVK